MAQKEGKSRKWKWNEGQGWFFDRTGQLNHFWGINEEIKFKQPMRRWPRGVGVGPRKQMLSIWHVTGRTQEQGTLQTMTQTWQSLASPTGDSLFEAIPGAGGPGPTDESWRRAQATSSWRSSLTGKVLLEGTQLPLHLCHGDTTSSAEAIKTILRDWVLCQNFWKLGNETNS